MEIEFKKAVRDDAAKMAEIQNICFEDDFKKYGKCPAYNESPDKMEKQIAERICYIIMIDGNPAGDIIVRPESAVEFYIRVLAIIPKYQNMGIGKKALRFLFRIHPEVTCWSLITPIENKRNCRFYESMGFKAVREVTDETVKLNYYCLSVNNENY